MKTIMRPAISLFVLLTAITGVAYPLLTTAIGKLAFPAQASGSLLVRDKTLVGSSLIGQNFSEPKYFWSRPSATSPNPNNALASGGSNLGPLNPALKQAVVDRIKALRDADPQNKQLIPVDLVTASASGLDPDISPAAARYQIGRIARVRKLAPEALDALVVQYTEGPQYYLFGEARVNVLKLNLALDKLE